MHIVTVPWDPDTLSFYDETNYLQSEPSWFTWTVWSGTSGFSWYLYPFTEELDLR